MKAIIKIKISMKEFKSKKELKKESVNSNINLKKLHRMQLREAEIWKTLVKKMTRWSEKVQHTFNQG